MGTLCDFILSDDFWQKSEKKNVGNSTFSHSRYRVHILIFRLEEYLET